MAQILNNYGNDEIVNEISEFIQSKVSDLPNGSFKAVLGDVIDDLNAQIDALEESENSEE